MVNPAEPLPAAWQEPIEQTLDELFLTRRLAANTLAGYRRGSWCGVAKKFNAVFQVASYVPTC
ncbi:hypothetical protein QZH63_08160, partial [Eikenella corrodens]|nr:hypothetical protein [Eikenella corrodens]